MNKILPLLLVTAILVGGCGSGNDPNLAKNPSTAEVDAAKQRKAELLAIYERAGGKWEQLTPEDKARVIELSNGNEAMAMQGWPALGSMK